MKIEQGRYKILRKTEISNGVYDLIILCPEIACQAKAGQFVQLRAEGFFLRRPISICDAEATNGTIRLIFEKRGAGTEKLAELEGGDFVDLIGPLGNGFRLPTTDKKIILIGGGIGVPPMLITAGGFGKNATAIIGFRSADHVILEKDFQLAGCDTRLATDDGSAGQKGFVTDLLLKRLNEGGADVICACGPMVMLKGIVRIAEKYSIPTQVSLEEHMACGVGACLVCACRTVRDGKEIFSHVCKDGPVFDAKEVIFE